MKIGYARVSTQEQNLDMQIRALEEVGCSKIYTEQQSARKDRPELIKAIEHLREGDIFVVWKIDRLGRSVKELVTLLQEFESRKIDIVFIKDGIDTSTSTGRFLFTIISAFAELELNIIRERTIEGLKAARARGKNGGRPKALTKSQIQQLRAMHADKSIPVKDIQNALGISRATVYKYLKMGSTQ